MTELTHQPLISSPALDLTPVPFPIAETFGITKNLMGNQITQSIQGYKTRHPRTPKLIDHYVFDRQRFFDVAYFVINPMGTTLLLSGPAGCGKSSLPEQLLARLNRPVIRVTGHEKMHVDDLLVRWVPDGVGGLRPVDGPLTEAFRNGYGFILDEVDALPPGELIGLNGLRDNGDLAIPQTGEVVPRHNWFRLIFTANTTGSGDQQGLFAGTRRQNSASLDGTRCVLCTYPDAEIEEAILEMVAPSLVGANLLGNMVKVANRVRGLSGSVDTDVTVSQPMSTRALVDWAAFTTQYQATPTPISTALHLAYGNRLDEDERAAVTEAARLVFGTLWK